MGAHMCRYGLGYWAVMASIVMMIAFALAQELSIRAM
jgi:hypothetical protein